MVHRRAPLVDRPLGGQLPILVQDTARESNQGPRGHQDGDEEKQDLPLVAGDTHRVPVAADRSFHVDFTVLNMTNVDAIDGEMTLQICDDCKFAKEPPEFTKLAGQDDRQRNKKFARIHYQVEVYTLSADIIAPRGYREVELGMYIRCDTCVREKEPQRIMVHLNP